MLFNNSESRRCPDSTRNFRLAPPTCNQYVCVCVCVQSELKRIKKRWEESRTPENGRISRNRTTVAKDSLINRARHAKPCDRYLSKANEKKLRIRGRNPGFSKTADLSKSHDCPSVAKVSLINRTRARARDKSASARQSRLQIAILPLPPSLSLGRNVSPRLPCHNHFSQFLTQQCEAARHTSGRISRALFLLRDIKARSGAGETVN